jgi:GIY-YIG catalytic domain
MNSTLLIGGLVQHKIIPKGLKVMGLFVGDNTSCAALKKRTTMKGKDIFTLSEISELRSLIKERIKADRSRQKGIRAKMRRIGFYGSDDFGITDLQPSDFERLITSGRVKIVGRTTKPSNAPKRVTKVVKKPTVTGKVTDIFTLFDPSKHTSNDIPDNPGNYIVCLKKGSKLPDIGVEYEMKMYRKLNVIYTGIAGKSLRKRDYRQHFKGNNAGSSTLRKSLGSLFGYTKIARDKDPNSGKTKFKKNDEIKLSEWMQSNLVLFFKKNLKPDKLEGELIKKLNPPLNLSKNKNIVNREFRSKLSELRSKK